MLRAIGTNMQEVNCFKDWITQQLDILGRHVHVEGEVDYDFVRVHAQTIVDACLQAKHLAMKKATAQPAPSDKNGFCGA